MLKETLPRFPLRSRQCDVSKKSSRPNPNAMQLQCLIRKNWVSATPEEHVRQQLLHRMVHELDFPASHIVLEKELRQLPHLAHSGPQVPNRRIDILCYAPNIHTEHALYPLLAIECKAMKLAPQAFNQIVGYNFHLKAPFVALANPDEVQLGWVQPDGSYRFMKGIAKYGQLIILIRN